MPVARVPPWVKISHRPGATVLASMATVMHCAPNFSAACPITSGLATAAVLKLTLSAPASSSARTSSTVRTPPPTVSGMKHCSAVRLRQLEQRPAVLLARGDVEKAELVRPGRVVGPRRLDRVARVDAGRRSSPPSPPAPP